MNQFDRTVEDSGNQPSSQPSRPNQQGYESPAIESVLTPEELEREVLYAGFVVFSGGSS